MAYNEYSMLIKCPECNREVSDQAVSCPHCGYPLKRATSILPKEDSTSNPNLVKLAERGGSRGLQIILYIAFGVFLVVGSILNFVSISLAMNNGSIVAIIVLAVLGELLFGFAVFGIIYLSVLLNKNGRVPHALVYFDKASDEFVFYSIEAKEIRLKKDASFFVRNNMRNVGEFILKENGKKRVILGFQAESIDLINANIQKYRN